MPRWRSAHPAQHKHADGGRRRARNSRRGRPVPKLVTEMSPSRTASSYRRIRAGSTWLRAQPDQPAATIAKLHVLLDRFRHAYTPPHHTDPARTGQHRQPSTTSCPRPSQDPRDTETHDRIRHDIVDKSSTVTLRVHGQLRRPLSWSAIAARSACVVVVRSERTCRSKEHFDDPSNDMVGSMGRVGAAWRQRRHGVLLLAAAEARPQPQGLEHPERSYG